MGEAFILRKMESYIKLMIFPHHTMGLLTGRVRPKHEILIALDVSIQDAQKELNETDKDQKEAGITPLSQGSEQYLKTKYSTFDHLKKRLLANITKVEKELEKINVQIAITTGKR